MSGDPREVRAQRWLSEQIEQLKALRNAKTRDSEFKQWRQATLTIIQRIWPGDARRHARFRRIPFSPPSTQADAREMREYYERGCAEALQLLGSFLDQIAKNGLPEPSAQARPAGLEPDMAEDGVPTLDLPGGPARAPRDPEPKRAAAPPPGAVSVRGALAPDDGPARRTGAERRKRQVKGGPRRRLRELLGLDAFEKLADRDARDATHADDDPPRHTQSDDDMIAGEREVAGAGTQDESRAEPPHAAAGIPPVADDAETFEPAAEIDEQDGDDADGDGGEPPFTADEFLSASPIFKTEGKPVRRAKREPPPPSPAVEADGEPARLTSSTAIAVAAIAGEVARLGVPESHRARTRAALVSLAQIIEDGDLDWDGLRGAVAFAMEFPPIARRLVPLLIPFLDRAA